MAHRERHHRRHRTHTGTRQGQPPECEERPAGSVARQRYAHAVGEERLRENGLPESQLPSNRPGLLQETRIWYVQATSRLEALLANIREMINSGVEIAEEKIGQVLEILTGSAQDVKKKSKSAADL